MTYLLSVYASTRQQESYSNQLLEEFERQFKEFHRIDEVKSRFAGDIPHLDFESQQAGRVPVEKHSDELSSAFALANELTDELQGAKALALATPMYNWGPPSSLKAWVDRIVNTRTFYANAGVLAGLPTTVIISSGGFYSEGENSKHDFLRPWLTECFSRIGIEDVTFVNCDPAGPMEFGRVDQWATESAYSKALRQIPEAVIRSR